MKAKAWLKLLNLKLLRIALRSGTSSQPGRSLSAARLSSSLSRRAIEHPCLAHPPEIIGIDDPIRSAAARRPRGKQHESAHFERPAQVEILPRQEILHIGEIGRPQPGERDMRGELPPLGWKPDHLAVSFQCRLQAPDLRAFRDSGIDGMRIRAAERADTLEPYGEGFRDHVFERKPDLARQPLFNVADEPKRYVIVRGLDPARAPN